MRAGLLGQLDDPEALLGAVRALRQAGYTRLDAFTPRPILALDEALGLSRSLLPWGVFPAGVAGVGIAVLIQWYCNAFDFRLNVGARPPFALPAFIPITFETCVLAASLTAFFSFFWMARLPRLSHPLFTAEGIERATLDGYFLGVSAADPLYDGERTRRELLAAGATRVVPFGEGAV
jgi:hypothetical protein